ncbi:MAG: enoyl-CoA hydratase/isomerase family protein [Deltaproteobacteria bacterium]|nr:enoyl-CoA hydratase/isomerase family protein [Deltaproteobacteria bacterium]
MTVFKDIIFEKADGVATITINRPPMNAMRYRTYAELHKACDLITADEEIRVVIITGGGERAFSVGGDVKAFYDLGDSVENAREYVNNASSAMGKIKNLEVPVIAAINGLAMGGGIEVMCACDFRVASEKAIFSQAEINIGLIPGTGGSIELPYIVGWAKAKEMVMLGRTYSAQDALDMGLVMKLVKPEAIMDEARALANELMSKSQTALSLAKHMMNTGINLDLTSARRMEIDYFNLLYMTKNAKEGLLSVIEKRKPQYRGEELVPAIKEGMAFKRGEKE